MQEKFGRKVQACFARANEKSYGRSQQVESDERRVLEAIFRREQSCLTRYLNREVGQDHAADIVQEVFLRAAASSCISDVANPRGFLRHIARNILIDRARRSRCRIVTLPLDSAAEARCDADQEHEIEADDLKASLEIALNALPERTRRIFIMHRFEDMAYREIHRELDISLAAVEYHMMKALSHIRRELVRV
jgi:RNA polymerase sigma factor (sigma-70 family)